MYRKADGTRTTRHVGLQSVVLDRSLTLLNCLDLEKERRPAAPHGSHLPGSELRGTDRPARSSALADHHDHHRGAGRELLARGLPAADAEDLDPVTRRDRLVGKAGVG